MAITPRIFWRNPAALAVASITMFGLSVFCSHHLQFDCNKANTQASAKVGVYEVPCTEVSERLGPQKNWTEMHWAVYTQCFHDRQDWRLGESIAGEGLLKFPSSEALTNMKAYSQIRQGDYRDAIDTLETGLDRFTPTDGTTENNLAWAGLWVENYSLDRARRLYQTSLRREANVCEVMHTGMMVEFGIAQRTEAYARAEALQNYQALRWRYQEECESRMNSGTRDNFVEVAGAIALNHEVDKMMGISYNLQTSRDLRLVVRARDSHFNAMEFTDLCVEAMPTQLDLRSQCSEAFELRAKRLANGEKDARLLIRR